MKMNKLGRTDLEVSELCLGTMTWGEQNTEAEGHEQMDYAIDHGINFLDAAELYPIPPKAKTQGRTEEIIGTWLNSRKNRDKVVISTKVVGRSNNTWFRDSGEKAEVRASDVCEAVEKSLKRLQTDYIDLYQIHWPDREVSQFGANPVIFEEKSGPENPVHEQLEALAEIIKSGKVRHVGLSNESAWGMMAFLNEATMRNLPRMQTIQNAYNLLNRTFETALAEIALREKISLLAYSPLAQGALTGKYLNGACPRGSRKALFDRLQRYETPGAEPAIASYVALAHDIGVDPVHLALKFAVTRPFTGSAIFSVTNMAQMKTALDSTKMQWTKEIEEKVNAIHLLHTNPCP